MYSLIKPTRINELGMLITQRMRQRMLRRQTLRYCQQQPQRADEILRRSAHWKN